MNTTLLIVLGEAVFVLAIVLFAVLFVNWRRKKHHNVALEQLLDAVTGQEENRKEGLIQYLTEHQKMDDQQALELCEDFVEAEKQFMYLFLEQQMKQTPVTEFYDHLCELLDKYLNLLPQAVELRDEETPQEAESATEETADAETVDMEEAGETNPPASSTIDIDEPDWDAAFAESGEEMNEAVKQEYDANTKKDNE